MSVRVSVIIPAFNAEQFIVMAVTSILDQAYSGDIEIIIIDDGSTDNTVEVVTSLAKNNNIILLKNERSKGPSGARNTGLLHATGEFIAFLDADDIWHSNHLSCGIPFLERTPEVDAVFFNFNIVKYSTKEELGDWFSRRKFLETLEIEKLSNHYKKIMGNFVESLLEESFVHLQSLIIRKNILQNVKFDESITCAEDRDFALNLSFLSNALFSFGNVITGTYYLHDGSITSKSLENDLKGCLSRINLYEKYINNYGFNVNIKMTLKSFLMDWCLSSSYLYRKMQMYGLSFIYIKRSFKYGFCFGQFKELAKLCSAVPVDFFNYLRARK